MTHGGPELEHWRCRRAASNSTRCAPPAVAGPSSPPSHRLVSCCRCGRERDDLAEFYADPPTQPRLFAGFP